MPLLLFGHWQMLSASVNLQLTNTCPSLTHCCRDFLEGVPSVHWLDISPQLLGAILRGEVAEKEAGMLLLLLLSCFSRVQLCTTP